MTIATRKNVNTAVAKYGVEVVKGNGYFYLMSLPGMNLENTVDNFIDGGSVFMNRIGDMSKERWIEHIEGRMLMWFEDGMLCQPE